MEEFSVLNGPVGIVSYDMLARYLDLNSVCAEPSMDTYVLVLANQVTNGRWSRTSCHYLQ